MPFVTFKMKKVIVDDTARNMVIEAFAKQLTLPINDQFKDTKIVIQDIYCGVDNTELSEWFDNCVVVILTVNHSKHHQSGQPLYYRFSPKIVKEEFDIDQFTYHGDDLHHARIDMRLRIDHGDVEYPMFNWKPFTEGK